VRPSGTEDPFTVGIILDLPLNREPRSFQPEIKAADASKETPNGHHSEYGDGWL